MTAPSNTDEINNEIQALVRKHTFGQIAPGMIGFVYNLLEQGVAFKIEEEAEEEKTKSEPTLQ